MRYTNIEVSLQRQTHFRLKQLLSEHVGFAQGRAWLTRAPPVLFIPGHMGKWTQIINIAQALSKRRPVSVFSLDFHSSASGFHGSIVLQQAEFTAAAILRVSELYAEAGQPNRSITLVAHSMGAIVALEALRQLQSRTSIVSSMIFLCSPVLGLTLVFEPRSAWLMARSRKELWGLQRDEAMPFAVVIGAGETDAMVPGEIAALPAGARGISLVTSAIRDVHASFSHVNLLFSRPSLTAVAGIIERALDNRIDDLVAELESPLTLLFRHVRHAVPSAPTKVSILEATNAIWMVASPSADGETTFKRYSGDVLAEVITMVGNSPTSTLGRAVSWKEMEAGQIYVFVAPAVKAGNGKVFTMALLEQPRPIRRKMESTSRGEDFDATDQINCAELAAVRFTVLHPETAQLAIEWADVRAMPTQYPLKACIFQLVPPEVADGTVIAVSIEKYPSGRSSAKAPMVGGWAHWQRDPFAAPMLAASDGGGLVLETSPGSFRAFGGVGSWFASIVCRTELQLPAGRGIITRLVTDIQPDLAPLLPLDISVVSGSMAATSWGLGAVLIAAAPDGSELQIAGLYPERRPSIWAAESSPGVFAPRFLFREASQGTRDSRYNLPSAPVFLVIGDPDAELALRFRANFWAGLSKIFRTYLGLILGTWLGATLMLRMTSLNYFGGCVSERIGLVLLWALTSSTLLAACSEPAHADAEHGFSPGAPSSLWLYVIHALGLSLAGVSAMVEMGCSMIAARCVDRCCCFSRHTHRLRVSLCSDVTFWMILATIHPSICLLATNIRCIVLRGSLRNRRREVGIDAAADIWLELFALLVALLCLCYAPSLILTGWIANGQHKEASSAHEQATMLSDLSKSQHALTPWVDSLLFGNTSIDGLFSFLPTFGVVLPALCLACLNSIAGTPDVLADIGVRLIALVSKAAIITISVLAGTLVGHRAVGLWTACELALLATSAPAFASVVMRSDRCRALATAFCSCHNPKDE